MRKQYSTQDIIEAVASSMSYAQVLAKLGLRPAGGNYASLRTKIKNLNLDTSHMLNQAHNRGKSFGPKRPLEEYLKENRPTSSNSLKKRLLKENLFEPKCYSCFLTEWQEHPIPLELEHINGNHDDNRLENLTLLCPNCHALTPTYRGKNHGSYKLGSVLPD